MNATRCSPPNYLQAVKDNKSALVVSPTHAEGGASRKKFARS